MKAILHKSNTIFLSSELTLLCLQPHGIGMLVFKKMLTDNGPQYFYSNYNVYFKSHELYEVCNFTISDRKSIKNLDLKEYWLELHFWYVQSSLREHKKHSVKNENYDNQETRRSSPVVSKQCRCNSTNRLACQKCIFVLGKQRIFPIWQKCC